MAAELRPKPQTYTSLSFRTRAASEPQWSRYPGPRLVPQPCSQLQRWLEPADVMNGPDHHDDEHGDSEPLWPGAPSYPGEERPYRCEERRERVWQTWTYYTS